MNKSENKQSISMKKEPTDDTDNQYDTVNQGDDRKADVKKAGTYIFILQFLKRTRTLLILNQSQLTYLSI